MEAQLLLSSSQAAQAAADLTEAKRAALSQQCELSTRAERAQRQAAALSSQLQQEVQRNRVAVAERAAQLEVALRDRAAAELEVAEVSGQLKQIQVQLEAALRDRAAAEVQLQTSDERTQALTVQLQASDERAQALTAQLEAALRERSVAVREMAVISEQLEQTQVYTQNISVESPRLDE